MSDSDMRGLPCRSPGAGGEENIPDIAPLIRATCFNRKMGPGSAAHREGRCAASGARGWL